MDILLNELSLSGQFGSAGDFIERGLTPFVSVISEIHKHSDNIILKKQNFWQSKVSATENIHDIFVGNISRTSDEIRKSKSLLAALIVKPFWETTRKHNAPDKYEFKGNDIFNSSLAESCERDKIIISFIHKDFSAINLSVSKNGTTIQINNFFNKFHYSEIAYKQGLISKYEYFDKKFKAGKITLLENECRFTKTNKIEQGQAVFTEITTNRYWYLDNLHKNHYEVFDNKGNHIGIADLQGIIDPAKRVAGRTITV